MKSFDAAFRAIQLKREREEAAAREKAAKEAVELPAESHEINQYTDSTGRFRSFQKKMPLHYRPPANVLRMRGFLSFDWVPRENNSVADGLADFSGF